MTETRTAPEQARFDFQWTEGRPWLEKTLGLAFPHLDRPMLRWSHECVRRLYLGPCLSALNTWTALELGGKATWVARHSALHSADFHLLASDLDLALVFRQTPTQTDLAQTARLYRKARSVLPFLGEVEVYTRAEWKIRQRLHRSPKVGRMIGLLWHLRKLGWIESSHPETLPTYHRLKKERALASSFQRLQGEPALQPRFIHLGASFARELDSTLTLLGIPSVHPHPAEPVRYYCDYLKAEINPSVPASNSLFLPPDLALRLLSVLPPAQRYCETMEPYLEGLREDHATQTARRFLVLQEWLTVKSRIRTHPLSATGNSLWLDRLRPVLARGGPLDWQYLSE